MPVDPWGGYTQSIDRLGQASRSKQRGQELRSLQDYRSQSMGLQQQRMNTEGKEKMNKFLGAVLKGVDSQEKLVYAAGLYYRQFPNEVGKQLFPAKWNKEAEQWANSYVNAYGDPDKPPKVKTDDEKVADVRKQLFEDAKEERAQEKHDKEMKNTGKPSALEKKISVIKEAYPKLNDKMVKRIAVGSVRVVSDPYTGNFALVDVGTGEQLPIKEAGQIEPSQVTEPEQPKQTLWDMAQLGTGPFSALRSGASVASGMLGGPVAEKTIQARQFISSAQNDLIRALSINPRFPVGEIKRLQEEINISPKLFDNPKMMRQRMIAVDDYLKRRLNKEVQVTQDSSLPIKDRRSAASAAKDIASFLKIMGVPEKTDDTGLSKEDEALINKYLPKE